MRAQELTRQQEMSSLKECVIALTGISYRDWVVIKTAVDRAFERQNSEFETGLKLADTDTVLKIIQSQFGRT